MSYQRVGMGRIRMIKLVDIDDLVGNVHLE